MHDAGVAQCVSSTAISWRCCACSVRKYVCTSYTNAVHTRTHKYTNQLHCTVRYVYADSMGVLLSKNIRYKCHAYDVCEATLYSTSCYFRDVGVLVRAMSIAPSAAVLQFLER